MQHQVLTFMLLIFVAGCESSIKPKPTETTKKVSPRLKKRSRLPSACHPSTSQWL